LAREIFAFTAVSLYEREGPREIVRSERKRRGTMEPPLESANAITRFFDECGYTEGTLNRLGLSELPWSALATLSESGWSVEGEPELDLLVRLFYLGESVAFNMGEKFIPQNVLKALLEFELLQRNGERLQGGCTFIKFGDLLLAFDSLRRFHAHPSDLVLGVNPATRILANCRMARPEGSFLDLGTGCGALALAVAPRVATVIATDINRRALGFARTNAMLNGVSNVSFLYGDRFEPVAGRQFNSIMSNPPFLLGPTSGMLYTENKIDLDGFVESLARTASDYLEEDGEFQMLCEWAELESESWEARLRSWFEICRCDVHIWCGYQFSKAEYARKRAVEQGELDPDSVGGSFGHRIAYLNERRVKSICGGLITLRRRSGENWFWVEEMQTRPAGPIGEALRQRYSTRDVVESKDEATILSARPRLAPQVRLMTESTQREGAWGVERSYLERTGDLPAKMVLDTMLANLAAHFDGTETLGTLLKQVASQYKVAMDRVIPEGLRITKVLATAGLILLDQP
jgi:methylase of polypeptide subunit release factors